MYSVSEQYRHIEAGFIPDVSKIYNILIIKIEVRNILYSSGKYVPVVS
jgi:hypothetical protein